MDSDLPVSVANLIGTFEGWKGSESYISVIDMFLMQRESPYHLKKLNNKLFKSNRKSQFIAHMIQPGVGTVDICK